MYRGNKLQEDATVKEVLDYETEDNYRIIAADNSVLEAVDIFKKEFGRGNRLEALLITEGCFRIDCCFLDQTCRRLV